MKVLKFFRNFYCVYLIAVLILSFFVIPFAGFQFKRNYAIGNMFHIAFAFLTGVFIIWLLKRSQIKNSKLWTHINSNKRFYQLIIISSAILLILQGLICYGGWSVFGWDTITLISPEKQMNSDWFSMYPNLLFLAGFFRRIYLFVCENLGLSYDIYYFILVILSFLSTWFTTILIPLIVKKFYDNTTAMSAYIIAFIFIGLSPWIMVPYSDNFSMLCTTLILFLYTNVKNKPIKYGLIILCSLIGYSIKPTAIFALFAIIFIELSTKLIRLYNFKKNIKLDKHLYRANLKSSKLETLLSKIYNKNHLNSIIKTDTKNDNQITKKISIKQFSLCSFSIIISIIISFGAINHISNYGLALNEKDNFTATHFLMMGLNIENKGGWNLEDVNISRSYDNIDERSKGNIKEWLNRLNIYGPLGVSEIFICKTMTNYGDGSFAWEAEKPWILENKGSNPIIWGIYGIDPSDDHDDNNNLFSYPRQWIWYLIIIGAIFCIFNQRPSKYECMICCTLLLISAFLTFFEPDPRYLMLYLPYLVILCPIGWKRFSKNITININKKEFYKN